MNVLDLFSGIGGFSLGLERAGMQTVAFCENEPYARKVLAKHWPHVPCYDDVRTLTGDLLRADRISVDVICGGFPCQDISVAGRGAGIEGERSGLWGEYARIIGEIRPRYVIVENVAALLGRGLSRVLGDLTEIGYDSEWHTIPASAVGAPHRRDRVWVVAYPNSQSEREPGHETETIGDRRNARLVFGGSGDRQRIGGTTSNVAYPDEHSREQWRQGHAAQVSRGRDVDRGGVVSHVRHSDISGLAQREGIGSYARPKLTTVVGTDWWAVEPGICRVVNGVPSRVDRLRCLGNSLVPQIPEMIGRALMAAN